MLTWFQAGYIASFIEGKIPIPEFPSKRNGIEFFEGMDWELDLD